MGGFSSRLSLSPSSRLRSRLIPRSASNAVPNARAAPFVGIDATDATRFSRRDLFSRARISARDLCRAKSANRIRVSLSCLHWCGNPSRTKLSLKSAHDRSAASSISSSSKFFRLIRPVSCRRCPSSSYVSDHRVSPVAASNARYSNSPRESSARASSSTPFAESLVFLVVATVSNLAPTTTRPTSPFAAPDDETTTDASVARVPVGAASSRLHNSRNPSSKQTTRKSRVTTTTTRRPSASAPRAMTTARWSSPAAAAFFDFAATLARTPSSASTSSNPSISRPTAVSASTRMPLARTASSSSLARVTRRRRRRRPFRRRRRREIFADASPSSSASVARAIVVALTPRAKKTNPRSPSNAGVGSARAV